MGKKLLSQGRSMKDSFWMVSILDKVVSSILIKIGIYYWILGRYEGGWVDSNYSGQGSEVWNDGAVYKGYFKKGVKNGEGVFRWPDGTVYEGQFGDNMMNGYGMLEYADGRKYTGYFRDNKM